MRIAGREVQITNRDRVFFPVAGYTKGDLLDYYLAVAEGAVRAVANRPMALKRFVLNLGIRRRLTFLARKCQGAFWRVTKCPG